MKMLKIESNRIMVKITTINRIDGKIYTLVAFPVQLQYFQESPNENKIETPTVDSLLLVKVPDGVTPITH